MIIHYLAKTVLAIAILFGSLPVSSGNEIDLNRLLSDGRCDHCNLQGMDLRGKMLSGASLVGSDLRGADLSDSNLRYVDLTQANLGGARLIGADLSGSRLQGARLYGVDLSETRLSGADMRDVDLRHIDIDIALEFFDLTGVLLEGAHFKDGMRCAGLPDKGGWGCAATPSGR